MGKVSNPYNFNIEQDYNSYSNIIEENYLTKFTANVIYTDGVKDQSLYCSNFNGDTSWIRTAAEYIYLTSFSIQYDGVGGVGQGNLYSIRMQIDYDYFPPAIDHFPDNIEIKINNIILNMPLIYDKSSYAYYGYESFPKEPKEIFEIEDELYQAFLNNSNITITIISQNLNPPSVGIIV